MMACLYTLLLQIMLQSQQRHLQQSKHVEVCWWFSQSSEQYRFAGELAYVGADYPDADRVALGVPRPRRFRLEKR